MANQRRRIAWPTPVEKPCEERQTAPARGRAQTTVVPTNSDGPSPYGIG